MMMHITVVEHDFFQCFTATLISIVLPSPQKLTHVCEEWNAYFKAHENLFVV